MCFTLWLGDNYLSALRRTVVAMPHRAASVFSDPVKSPATATTPRPPQQASPSSAFAPCAITPDELGAAWDGGRVHLPLLSSLNGAPFGKPNAGIDMTFDFGQLVAHAAATRPLCAGGIIGSGTVSNRDADGGPGKPVAAGGLGYSCIAEMRMVETIASGKPQTPFMKFGDRVRIEMRDARGASLFGAIEQTVRAAP